MKRTLLVGDPHLKLSRLEDAKEFGDKLVAEVESYPYDIVIILGDLFDSYAVIRSEILTIWTRVLKTISSKVGQMFILVGNHDLAGARGGTHALEPFKDVARIVDDPDMENIEGQKVYFLPFYRDNAEFEALCRQLTPGSVLFCHNSFNGAKFENDGVLTMDVGGDIYSNTETGESILNKGTISLGSGASGLAAGRTHQESKSPYYTRGCSTDYFTGLYPLIPIW